MHLDAFVDGGATLSYRIGHAWAIAGGECASLFSVLEPGPLARTTVLLRERPFESYPRVWVQLATARRPVPVRWSDAEANILGTDFAYDDLRTWTPRFVTAARSAEVRDTDGDEHLVLAAEWLYRQRTRVRAIGRIGRQGLPVHVAWTMQESAEPFKTLRADGIEAIDRVWMPAEVTVRRPGEGYTSCMKLRAARIGRLVDPRLFEATALPAAHETLQLLSASL